MSKEKDADNAVANDIVNDNNTGSDQSQVSMVDISKHTDTDDSSTLNLDTDTTIEVSSPVITEPGIPCKNTIIPDSELLGQTTADSHDTLASNTNEE